ncbi:MAG TPA: hypothetical protein VF142_19595 [Longimicrobium sp.]
MSRFRLGSILAVAGILITGGGCTDTVSAPVQPGQGLELLRAPQGPSLALSGSQSASKVIGPEGGVIALPGGHELVFPAGALSQPTEIGIRSDGQYQGVHLSPHGLVFPAGAEPVLTLRATGPEAAAFSSLVVTYVDDARNILEVLPTSRHGNTVTAHLEHFSGYIVGGGRSAEQTSMP